MADITATKFRTPTNNSEVNIYHQDAWIIAPVEDGISEDGTHQFAVLPKGRAITGVTVIPVEAVTGSTLVVKAKVGANEYALNSAFTLTTQNAVVHADVSGVAAYFPNDEITLELTFANDVTAGKFIIIVDSVNVNAFLENG